MAPVDLSLPIFWTQIKRLGEIFGKIYSRVNPRFLASLELDLFYTAT
jgi:hypothetical protein